MRCCRREKVGDVNGFWQSGFMPCISIFVKWIRLNNPSESSKNFTFIPPKQETRRGFFSVWILMWISALWQSATWAISRVHLSIPENEKTCSTNAESRVRGRMSTTINYARNATNREMFERRAGTQLLSSCGVLRLLLPATLSAEKTFEKHLK